MLIYHFITISITLLSLKRICIVQLMIYNIWDGHNKMQVKLIHCVYFITFTYNICLHAHARPALSIRDNNHGSTTPSRFTIGTFNVRRLSPAKRRQLSEDLGRLRVDNCCLPETKSPGGFDARPGKCRLLGLHSQSRRYGLVFDVST